MGGIVYPRLPWGGCQGHRHLSGTQGGGVQAGGGGTRLLRAGKAVLDEPPEGLYNRWVKERLEYYRRVEPSAPLRDVSIVDQKVPKFRFSQTTQTGHVSNAIWELILRNPEAAALKRIDDIAKGAA